MEKQRYNLLSAQDIAVWRANCKLTAAIQASVKDVGYVRATENNLERLKQAKIKAEEIFHTMKKQNM